MITCCIQMSGAVKRPILKLGFLDSVLSVLVKYY